MPTGEQIREWNQTLKAGKALVVGGSELDKAVKVALARKNRGAGPDRADTLGPEAMALVEQAL